MLRRPENARSKIIIRSSKNTKSCGAGKPVWCGGHKGAGEEWKAMRKKNEEESQKSEEKTSFDSLHSFGAIAYMDLLPHEKGVFTFRRCIEREGV